jgi:hypothetical protein
MTDRLRTNVRTERIRRPDGSVRIMLRIDGNSPTLGSDLTYAFQQNVKRARAENRRLLGTSDFEPKKPRRD